MNFLTDPYITVIFGGVVSVAAPVLFPKGNSVNLT